MTKSKPISDYERYRGDGATGFAAHPHIESPQETARRALRAAIEKEGLEPDDLDPAAQRVYDRAMGVVDAPTEEEEPRQVVTQPAKPRGDPNPPPAFSAAVTAILDEQGRDSDDPAYQQLLGYRYTSEAMALEKIRALGPKAGAKPMPDQRLDEAVSEWEGIMRNPTAAGEAGRKRRAELQEIIRQLEATGG